MKLRIKSTSLTFLRSAILLILKKQTSNRNYKKERHKSKSLKQSRFSWLPKARKVLGGSKKN